MAKRELRVIQRIGPAPYMAVCTACHREFKVTSGREFTVGDATETLERQFVEHKCDDMSAATAGIVRDATRD